MGEIEGVRLPDGTGLSPTAEPLRVSSAEAASIPDAVTKLLADIDIRTNELEREIYDREQELVGLKRVQAALGVRSGRSVNYPHADTIAGAVMRILQRGPMLSREICDLLPSVYGRNIPRTSIAPQLSRLMHGGLLERRGKTWALTAQAIETRSAETAGLRLKDESAVDAIDAPNLGSPQSPEDVG